MSTEPHEPRDALGPPAETLSVDQRIGAPLPNEASPTRGAALASDSTGDRRPATTLDAVGQAHMGRLIDMLVHHPASTCDEASTIRFGHYEAMRMLGAGGMGEVFAARHLDSGETVALKTLSSTTATRLYRFKREFRALADVSHRNLIRLHELVVPEVGPAFFTMELLDGQPFVEWVRGRKPVGMLPEIERLEHALRQLVEGVHHLHAHGCIHRDLKPSNVLVTSDGRVVVLDFGLVSELSEPERGITHDRQVLGTPSYMAPEQALAKPVGPAADWYAVGAILFECLTGRLPHEGPALVQMLAKHDLTPDPGDDVVGIPEQLRMLCVRLLARNPDARPSARELLEHLRAPTRPATVLAPAFVGRREELAMLHTALHEVVERRETVVLHLRGRSGDGKSALVHRFRSELRSSDALVLHGRCREREMVPYKGVDAVVDALSAHLRRLPEPQRGDLRPNDLDALVRLFPVLDEIWARGDPAALGPSEIRRLGGVTLRKLLKRMADQQPVIVHIDDVQWADLDSVSLLHDLVRPPDSPALLLLFSYRTDADDADALRRILASEILSGARSRTLQLGSLPSHDARALASSLLRASDRSAVDLHARAEAIALRARGSPFFIAQIALGGSTLDAADSDLDQIIVRRLSELDPDQRRLLEVVATFGGPLPATLALELCDHANTPSVAALCELGLLVRDDVQSGETGERIETAHDRVREVVMTQITSVERARLHRRIGKRLLAQHQGLPAGDDVFAVTNHLDAGMEDVEALPDELRLELARLNCRAGERARDSTGWVAARRYFDFAYGLVDPWLADACEGRGHHELCVAIAFGRAQAEAMIDDAAGDAAFHELLDWRLTPGEYRRIAEWYNWNLGIKGRWPESVDFGLQALAHLGVRVPRRPSLPRALVSHVWGWRAIQKLGLDRLRTLPPIEDDGLRTTMELLAGISAYAVNVDVNLHLLLLGIYNRRLVRHGYHEGVGIMLSSMVMSAAARGKSSEARELWESTQRFVEECSTSSFARYMSEFMLLVALPTFHPVREVTTICEQVYQRAREVAPRPLVELIGWACSNCYELRGVPLSELSTHLDTMEAQHDCISLPVVANAVTFTRQYIHSLMQGGVEALPSRDLVGLRSNARAVAMATVRLLWLSLLFGDHDRAWGFTCELDRDYERRLGPMWQAPAYAMLSTIVMSDRWSGGSARERQRMRRMLRKRKATARRWAAQCGNTYQPMLDIVDGELAALEQRYDAAMAALEHARSLAIEHRMTWLAALASERLAKLALRRGHAILADAAFIVAREAYEDWGATAIVRRIERERTLADRRALPTAEV